MRLAPVLLLAAGCGSRHLAFAEAEETCTSQDGTALSVTVATSGDSAAISGYYSVTAPSECVETQALMATRQ